MSWLAFAVSYLGVACLAFAMTIHQRTVFGRPPVPIRVRAFRLSGYLLLVAALLAAITTFGWQAGLVAWIALLAFSGFTLTQFLAYAPRFALAPLAPLLLAALLASIYQ